jgi:hypothetical protein
LADHGTLPERKIGSDKITDASTDNVKVNISKKKDETSAEETNLVSEKQANTDETSDAKNENLDNRS